MNPADLPLAEAAARLRARQLRARDLVEAHLDRIAEVYHRHGFDALETSGIETVEALASMPELNAVMDGWDAWQQLVVAGNGRRLARPLFDRARLPRREQAIRQTLKANALWLD